LSLSFKNSDSLKNKIQDISYILSAYDALIEGKYVDDCGSLDLAVDLLVKKGSGEMFPQKVIFDEFWYFTGEQRNLIQYFLKEKKEVYVPLETSEEFKNICFSFPEKTGSVLKALAEEIGEKWEIEKGFSENLKHTTVSMKNLWESYKGNILKTYAPDENVVLTECPDAYSEVSLVAARINDLVMKGYKYSDFAVVIASGENYRYVVADAFKKYNIPAFTDFRLPLSESGEAVFSSLFLSAAVASDADIYLSMCKTGFIEALENEISDLEQYSFIWNLTGKDFEKEFTLSPSGFENKKNKEAEDRKLKKLNELREKIVSPVLYFRNKCKTEALSGSEKTKLLYEILWNRYKINERLSEIYSDVLFENEAEKMTKQKAAGVFSAFSEMFSSLYNVLADTAISLKDYKEIFSIFSSLCKTGDVPKLKDAVPIGEVGRVRTEAIKGLFIVGASDDAFPKVSSGGELFGRKEKIKFKNQGLDFIKIAEDSYLEELFTVYKTLMLPREKLYISYSLKDFSGEAKIRSEIFSELEMKFSGLKTEDYNEIDKTVLIKSAEGAFSELAKCFNDNTPYSAALKTFLSENGRKSYVEALSSFSVSPSGTVENTELLNSLYPKEIFISPSKAEMFFKCRFSYFCRYTLGIKPWKKAELAPTDTGTLIHFVLEKAVALLTDGKLETKDIEPTVAKLMEEYLEEELGGKDNKDPRFLRAYKGVEKLLCQLLAHLGEELSQSEFVPSDFELNILSPEAVEENSIDLPSGKKLIFNGFIDRVDILEKNGKKYVRVVDYKSGKKDFSLSDINYGLNMQMLLYLMVLTKFGKGKYKDALPAGVLYMPAREPQMLSGREVSKEEAEATIKKAYTMKGLLLNNREILAAMEKGLDGRFIPVGLKNNEITTTSLASLEEFGYIGRRINEKLIEMAKALSEGKFFLEPLELAKDKLPCEYCDYRSICGKNEDTPTREKLDVKKDDVLEEMRKCYGEGMD
jgi:ATP-dependent helicase/nuclease subunit B